MPSPRFPTWWQPIALQLPATGSPGAWSDPTSVQVQRLHDQNVFPSHAMCCLLSGCAQPNKCLQLTLSYSSSRFRGTPKLPLRRGQPAEELPGGLGRAGWVLGTGLSCPGPAPCRAQRWLHEGPHGDKHPLSLLGFSPGSRVGEAKPAQPQRRHKPRLGGFCSPQPQRAASLQCCAPSPAGGCRQGCSQLRGALGCETEPWVWAGTKRADALVLGGCRAPASTGPSCAFHN